MEPLDFDPKDWAADKAEIIRSLSKYADEFQIKRWTEKSVEYFLDLHFHLMKDLPRPKQRHTRQVLTIARRLIPRGKSKGPDKRLTPDEILALPDWVDFNNGCFINVVKDVAGKRKEFTIRIDPNGESIVLEKPQFVPVETQPSLDFMDNDPASVGEIFIRLVAKFQEYLYFDDDIIYEIMAAAAIATFFREVFDSYPYFDFYSAEYNCGKTTAMKCLIWASFYGFLPLDPTGPVLFRAVDACKSAAGIDELDNLLKDENIQSRFLGLLNAAYQKGLAAYRIDKEQQFLPVPYDPFGLKSFTHTKAVPESIRSRSITIAMIRSPVKLPLLKTAAAFLEERDMIYKFRMTSMDEIRESYIKAEKESTLSNRDNQKFVPLFAIARLVSEDVYQRMILWATDYSERHIGQEIDEIRRALVEVLLDMSGDVKAKYVRDTLNELCVERELLGKKKDGTHREFGSRRVMNMCASLGILKSNVRTDHNVHIRIIPKRIKAWAEQYGIIKREPPKAPIDLLTETSPATEEETKTVEPRSTTDNNEMKQEREAVRGLIVAENVHSPNPADAPPEILIKVAKAWDDANVDRGMLTKYNDERHPLFMSGLEAGYLREEKPGWWGITTTGLNEMGRYGL